MFNRKVVNMKWFRYSVLGSGAMVLALTSIPLSAGFLDKLNKIDPNAIGAATDVFKSVTLSESQMVDMSKKSAKEMDGKNPVSSEQKGDKTKYGERLNKLFGPHKNEDGLKLNYKAYVVKDFNAFAMPDGSVRVFAGLMDKLTDEEILGVIGHEIGHVKLKHSLRAYKKALLASGVRKGVASAGGAGGELAAGQLGAVGQKFVSSQFSQAHELEADLYGINFLKKHGYNPRAMVTAFQKMKEEAGEGGGLLASHPATSKRIEKMEAQID